MDLQDRIKVVIQLLIGYKVADNQEVIGFLLGYKNKSSFSQIINGKVALPADLLKKLANLDDRISKEWLINDSDTPFYKQVYNENDYTGEEPVVSYIKNGIPLVEGTAIGGFWNSKFSIEKRDVKAYYVIPKFQHKQVDFMIEVEGSSMYPKYNSGDVVACRILKEQSFIQWNKTHVIATKDQGIIIKRIKKGENGSLLMISDNKDYDPFPVPEDEIEGIALVVGVIRLE